MRKLIRCVSSVITHRAKWALRLPMNVRREGRRYFRFGLERRRDGFGIFCPVQLHTHYPMHQHLCVESAGQMFDAATSLFYNVDVAIMAAAVADYTPEQVADKKIKREKTGDMSLNLKPTQDIAACLGEMKERYPGKILVGFALETNNEQYNAEDKLKRKNLDFIVLNSLNDKGAGFRCDTNKISIIDRSGKKDYPLKSKAEVAADIIDHLVEVMNS